MLNNDAYERILKNINFTPIEPETNPTNVSDIIIGAEILCTLTQSVEQRNTGNTLEDETCNKEIEEINFGSNKVKLSPKFSKINTDSLPQLGSLAMFNIKAFETPIAGFQTPEEGNQPKKNIQTPDSFSKINTDSLPQLGSLPMFNIKAFETPIAGFQTPEEGNQPKKNIQTPDAKTPKNHIDDKKPSLRPRTKISALILPKF
jgi:hypothetical protein